MSEQPPNTPPPPPSGQPGEPYNPPPAPQQPYNPPPQQPYQQAGGYQQPGYQQPGYQQPGQFGGAPTGYGAPGQLGERFLARLIDGFVLAIPIIIVNFVFSAIFLRGFTYSTGEYLLFWLFTSVAWVAIELGYFGFLESSRGQTVGKMAMKLKTVGPDGVSNPTMAQAIRRNFFYAIQLVYIIPILGSIVGGLAMLGVLIYIAITINNDTANRQGFHDHFGEGTRVIKVG